jgi:nitroreductase
MTLIDASIRERWSPVHFTDRALAPEEVRALFEAARWAPSSMNEQPWRFLHAARDEPEAFERFVSCLVEQNAAWARHAAMLVLAVAATDFSRTGRENRHAWHDTGMAVENLLLQAAAMGLQGHPMAGFSRSKALELFGIPEGFEPVVMVALGAPGDPGEGVDTPARSKEARRRRPLDEILFTDRWGDAPEFL